jgi:lipoprotein-anchoring transpeptidase ErfK/SrfK
LYNNLLTKGDDKKAREAYNRSIETGELTPMASFELYQAISKEIDDVIVGTTTANGIAVKSKSEHFIARVIGSVAQRRSGVSIADVVLALTNPDRIDPVRQGAEGKSQRFMKHGVCAVTINPETGNLIQVNPLR